MNFIPLLMYRFWGRPTPMAIAFPQLGTISVVKWRDGQCFTCFYEHEPWKLREFWAWARSECLLPAFCHCVVVILISSSSSVMLTSSWISLSSTAKASSMRPAMSNASSRVEWYVVGNKTALAMEAFRGASSCRCRLVEHTAHFDEPQLRCCFSQSMIH